MTPLDSPHFEGGMLTFQITDSQLTILLVYSDDATFRSPVLCNQSMRVLPLVSVEIKQSV